LSNPNWKGGSHTITEILSQPETWRKSLALLQASGELADLAEQLPRKVEWTFVGCGSSFYLAQVAAATWSMVTGEVARAMPASEMLLFPSLLPQPCQPVLISRSGQTSEMIDVANYLEREQSIRTLGVTCGNDSRLQKICSHAIRMGSADEQSTVMTRSFTSMLIALQALAAKRSGRPALPEMLQTLPSAVEKQLENWHSKIQAVVNAREFADYVFLAQGPFYGIAQEATLKITEMSCSYAQTFHTLEFRHGPKSLVGPDVLLTFFVSKSGYDAEAAVVEEMKELGGATLVITNAANSALRRAADYLVELELDVPEPMRAAAAVIPGQLLGFYTGLRKGLDPDQPRHLSRVVMLGSGPDGGPNRAAP
jgi:glucosamine--fructose-6-phosphate aminotransferase (isomerizing)